MSGHPGQTPAGTVVTLAIDAGGTFMKGGVLENGILLAEPYLEQPSRSEADAESFIAHFASLIIRLAGAYMKGSGTPEHDVTFRIGTAFPGPFDYERGISRIRGLGKYEQLYGVSVGELLKKELRRRAGLPGSDPWMQTLADADIAFGNDAVLFGMGAAKRYPGERLLCLTLGTGLGSVFMDRGRTVSGSDGVPESGMLYAETFEGAPVDGQFGRRGVLALADALQARRQGDDVIDLAAAAARGESAALRVWRTYGERLGRMLRPYAASFRPDRLILGGQIAKSLPLFVASLTDALLPVRLPVLYEDDLLRQVFYGADMLFD
ncbi:ROK family protein [Paenibacillus cellulositrophicus]|uniref:ROK family protein n=1 Tax=Paenibacillus cellulositrophicus TaxID=562959 RepID=UPI003F81EAB4